MAGLSPYLPHQLERRPMRAGEEQKRMAVKQGGPPAQSTETPRLAKQGFVNEVWSELKKTNWPSYEEGIRMTGIVLLVITIFTSVLFLLDFVLSHFWHLVTPTTGV